MLLDALILELGDCTMSILPNTDLKKDFATVMPMGTALKHFSDQTLHFCTWSDLNAMVEIPPITAVIYDDYSDELVDYDNIPSHFKKIVDKLDGGLVFNNKEEFVACFQCFDESFLHAYEAEKKLQDISEAIYNNEELQVIANKIAEMFDYPINIVDNSFSLLVSSTNYEFFNEDLKRDHRIGYIPPEVLKQLNIASRRRRNDQSKTIIIDHIDGQFHNFFTPILFNNVALGYYSVFTPPDEEISPILRSYLSRVSMLLGIYMQRTDYQGNSRSNYYTTLLSSLLSENPRLNDISEERFEVWGHQLKKYKCIYVVQFSSENQDNFSLQDLCRSFKKIFGNCIYTISGSQIIFLASYDPLGDNFSTIGNACENFLLSLPNINVGAGSPFTVLAEARGHYIEAIAAINTGLAFRAKNRVFFYDNYRLMNMVQTLSTLTDVRLFSLPQLLTLQEYDKHHDSELLNTLYVYVNNSKNINKSCEDLHIHRNTLYFRLNKISQLTQLNLEAADTIAMILISFVIMRLQGEL